MRIEMRWVPSNQISKRFILTANFEGHACRIIWRNNLIPCDPSPIAELPLAQVNMQADA